MTDSDTAETRESGDAETPAEPTTRQQAPGVPDQVAFWASAAFGLALATASVWFVGEQGVWHEALQRVHPTVSGGGVGAEWEAGVANTVLNWAIELVHVADIVMGIFILLMMFVHWTAFHRLADRMRPPEGEGGDPE